MSDNNLNQLEIKSVLVVDDDEVARNMIANHLGRLGYTNITLKEDGDAAWTALRETKFDLIVLDWKLPKLSGLALFSRIRRRAGYRTTPLLVVSGLLDKHDFRLLQEYPCTGLMEKPFTQVLFENRLDELKKETVWYGQNVTLVDTLLDAVQRDGKKAEQLLKQILKKAPNPIPLALIAARRLVRARMLKSAQTLLESVLKIDDESVIAMNELGKVLHLQGAHKPALDVLRNANRLSPQNMSRLCLLGEVELNLTDPEAAKRYFEQALAIDADDRKAQAGVVVADNMEELLGAPEPLHVPRSFASILNTMGITFVRNGQFNKGISQYQSALAFLHGRGDVARVTFNLGLAFLRWGKPAEALPWFQKSEAAAPNGFGKSAAYVRQLLTTGVEEVGDKVQEADFAPTSADADATATLHDDAEPGAKVIPFPDKKGVDENPASSASKGKELVETTEETEETEVPKGTQVVL